MMKDLGWTCTTLELQQLVIMQYLTYIYISRMSVLGQTNPTRWVKTKTQQLFGIKTYSTYAAERCATGEGRWLHFVTQH